MRPNAARPAYGLFLTARIEHQCGQRRFCHVGLVEEKPANGCGRGGPPPSSTSPKPSCSCARDAFASLERAFPDTARTIYRSIEENVMKALLIVLVAIVIFVVALGFY